jgi:hypothetical protein
MSQILSLWELLKHSVSKERKGEMFQNIENAVKSITPSQFDAGEFWSALITLAVFTALYVGKKIRERRN